MAPGTELVGSSSLHPAVSALAFLLGAWRGEGQGEYPTIETFGYGEELAIGHVGKPFLSYVQRTWSLDDDRPLHAETGYLRAGDANRVELVLAHPTGVVEMSEGTIEGTTLDLHSRLMGSTATAKSVTSVSRRLEVDGDELRYVLSMAAVGRPEVQHLTATLQRVAAGATTT